METLRFLMVSTFYPPYHLGGDAVHVQYLAEALAARGHEVHVEYSPSAYRVKRGASRRPLTDVRGAVQVHPIPDRLRVAVPASAYLLGTSRAATRFHERLAREIRPDVVHLHNISLLGLGVEQRYQRRPLLYTAHDYWFRCPRSDLLKNGRTPCDRPACFGCMVRSRRIPPPWRPADLGDRLEQVDCVIAPSKFMMRLAEASFRCPVVHLPNFAPDVAGQRYGGPDSSYYLYVGVLEKHKGLPALAEAAVQRSGVQFVLVGRGSLEPQLRELATRYPTRLEVRSDVDAPALAALLGRASAFVMPSIWYENAPLAAIEALAWGTPLLVTSRGGVGELTYGGSAGLTFEPNVEGLNEALATFEDRTDVAALRLGARRAYEDHHRPEAYVGPYLSLVDSLLAGKDPAASGEGAGARPRPEGPTSAEVLVPHGHHHP